MRVNRNHFGRQTESFETDLDLPFLKELSRDPSTKNNSSPFRAIFIRAPVVERVLPIVTGEQVEEAALIDTITAPSMKPLDSSAARLVNQQVEILAALPKRRVKESGRASETDNAESAVNIEAGDIVAVKQGNVFGTSFHPELTADPRIHMWWLKQVLEVVESTEKA